MKKIKLALLTTFLAGTLDGAAAVIQYILSDGGNPLNVFRFIASGIFGSSALAGGLSMALAGILLHYLIAGIWVSLFFWLYPSVKPTWSNKYISGILYGVIVWFIMNQVVLPLSNTPPLPHNLLYDVIGILILIVAIGLPISFIYDRTTLDRGPKRNTQPEF